jgi:hypothetical protein
VAIAKMKLQKASSMPKKAYLSKTKVIHKATQPEF